MLLTKHPDINDIMAVFSNAIKSNALMSICHIEPLDLIKDVYYSNCFQPRKKTLQRQKSVGSHSSALVRNKVYLTNGVEYEGETSQVEVMEGD